VSYRTGTEQRGHSGGHSKKDRQRVLGAGAEVGVYPAGPLMGEGLSPTTPAPHIDFKKSVNFAFG
jgi:hypothetical protein